MEYTQSFLKYLGLCGIMVWGGLNPALSAPKTTPPCFEKCNDLLTGCVINNLADCRVDYQNCHKECAGQTAKNPA
jgi:hypothetical protein